MPPRLGISAADHARQGLWAVIPDLPHTLGQNLPDAYQANFLDTLTKRLHTHGNWFFFQGRLDVHYEYEPWNTERFGLRGIALIVLGYEYALFRAYDWLAAKAACGIARLPNCRTCKRNWISYGLTWKP